MATHSFDAQHARSPPMPPPASSSPRRRASVQSTPVSRHHSDRSYQRDDVSPELNARQSTSRRGSWGRSPILITFTPGGTEPGGPTEPQATREHLESPTRIERGRSSQQHQSEDHERRPVAEHQPEDPIPEQPGGPAQEEHHSEGSVAEDAWIPDHSQEDVIRINHDPRPRINRVQTPFQRPRSIESSIDESSPVQSPPPAMPSLAHPGPHGERSTAPPDLNRGSMRSHHRSRSSYTTDTPGPTPTTTPTTPASPIGASLSRPSPTDYQPAPNPLPRPPVDIFALPENQDLWNRLVAPFQTPGVPVENATTRPVSGVQNERKKGLLVRIFSFKKQSTSSPVQHTTNQSPLQGTYVNPASQPSLYTATQPTPQSQHAQYTPHSQHTGASIGATWPAAAQHNSSYTNAGPAMASSSSHHAPMQSVGLSRSASLPNAAPPTPRSNRPLDPQAHNQPRTQPHPQYSLPQPNRILFNENSERSYFLMQSPHPVFYEDEMYPTAAHLLEALKFLPHRPDIAQRIRECEDLRQAQQISAAHKTLEDPGFSSAVVENTYKVVNLKFRQHADLRYKLCELNHDAQIVFNDISDPFWGVGINGRGDNQLGKVLRQVMRELKPRRHDMGPTPPSIDWPLLTPAHNAAAPLAVRKVVWRALLGRLFLAFPPRKVTHITETGSASAIRRLGRLNGAASESWGAFLKATEGRIGVDLSSVAFVSLPSFCSLSSPDPDLLDSSKTSPDSQNPDLLIPQNPEQHPEEISETAHDKAHPDPTTSPHPTLTPRLASLHVLRCLLGPVVEGAIILDRVEWLRVEIATLSDCSGIKDSDGEGHREGRHSRGTGWAM
ncbi:hypothetical protein DXG01_001624 [Tephrocybe rancida]|nr:hypothetical protein DXG01_001624 [Tephrocybe rancida]